MKSRMVRNNLHNIWYFFGPFCELVNHARAFGHSVRPVKHNISHHYLEYAAMQISHRLFAVAAVAMAVVAVPLTATSASARSAAEITAQGQQALQSLEAREPRSRLFARHARAVLVFPSIFKAGLVFGGESGNGVLLIDGRPAGFYNLSGGSWGLQIGGEKFSYALFLMNNAALRHLRRSGNFDAGTGPSVAIITTGAGAEANSTTMTKDVYAFPFNEKGLMADLTLQGTKISAIHPR